MFRLTRTYSVASFFGIVLVTIALGIFYKTVAVRSLIVHETLANVSLTQSISNTLWPVYADFVARAATIPPPELIRQAEISRLREDVLQKINGLRVVKIKIYNLDGLTVYSTEPAQIGEDKSHNSGFLKAKAGHTESDLVFRDHFSATEEIIVNRNLLSSYIPIRKTPHDPVEGVFEIYSDVTPLVAEIERTEYTVLGGVSVLLLLLYLFLLMIVRRADRVIKAHENEERKAQAEQIHYMAYHDPLTGLANRALFKDRFQHAVAVAARTRSPLGIMFIDIDRFKVINDSLGHEGGDAVLIEAAKRIRACLRASDTACRIGGDEFTVILENLPTNDDAAQAATRLIQKFAEPLKIGDREIIVTASIGISIFPGATHDVQRLLKDANAAMHEAKESGRNRHVFYTQEMDARAQESLEYEMGLRKALQNGEFLIYYQPRVNTATGKVVGAEALLRWQHPSRGIIAPDNFIPLLEDTGLVIPVGEWVLLQACRQCQDWHAAGNSALSVSVNLSMKQFRSGSLLASVRRALEESGLPPRFLELELTETVLVDDAEQALDLMRELKDIGVSISIDDFGTGYSSLNYLRRFPIDLLKIDSSFIRDVVHNRGDAAITTTIAVMAKSLHLGILAEGVETREQARFLKTIGCHDMQGNLFGPAIPAEDFGAQLETLDVPKLAGFEPKSIPNVPGNSAVA
ncbi:MAG TPA: EAL domain-containing protein [Sulfuricaulis sp.]|nr:EAL domain-containing protein [Sulfuricaulis sp.]